MAEILPIRRKTLYYQSIILKLSLDISLVFQRGVSDQSRTDGFYEDLFSDAVTGK